jgi:hypothetical protein
VTFVALCGETQPESAESSNIRGLVRRNAPSQEPAGTFVALCGETQPESGESSDIRGLVRRNAPSQELTRDREDDLADVVAGFETRMGGGGFGEREHGQRRQLDGVVGDQRPDVLYQAAADRCLLLPRSGAQ